VEVHKIFVVSTNISLHPVRRKIPVNMLKILKNNEIKFVLNKFTRDICLYALHVM